MATAFVYTMIMMLLLYSCCDHTGMKGNLISISISLCEVFCTKYYMACTVEGRVTTALPEVATVCNGSQLELNCTITGSALEWRFIPEQNHSQLSAITHLPIRNQSFQYGDSTVTFTITSHPMKQASYYRIVISPIINSLNGTEVKCTDLEDQESSSTVISIVNDQGSVIYKPWLILLFIVRSNTSVMTHIFMP